MKSCFTFFFFLIALSVSSQKKELPVRVIEATQQNWVSGAPGGKTGTKYAIKVYINTAKKAEFKNLWIGGENVLFDVEFFSLDIPKKIQQGDSLLLTYNKINGQRNDNPDAKRLPIPYNGAALIETTVDGKARYFLVKGFKKLPDLRGK